MKNRMKQTKIALFIVFLCLNAEMKAQCWLAISESRLYHSIGIKTDGTLWAWGDNSYGHLGVFSAMRQPKPLQLGTVSVR